MNRPRRRSSPTGELVAGDVEHAPEQKEEPNVTELREQCEEHENRVRYRPVERLGDSDTAALWEHVRAEFIGFTAVIASARTGQSIRTVSSAEDLERVVRGRFGRVVVGADSSNDGPPPIRSLRRRA
jgi:hypothetical protein